MTNTQHKTSSFLVLISVFFFWGFVAASNDILIPVFKEKLNLEQWQSQMISFAFYVAYTVGSIIYYLASKFSGGDVLNRMGYKNGIALGLMVSAIGTLLFYPAAQTSSFLLTISGLFIVGLGFSLQQTAANTLAIMLGDPNKASQRLSLAGGVNSFATMIGPRIINFAIFGTIILGGAQVESLESIKTPYLIIGAAFIIVALFFKFSSLPERIIHDEAKENPDKTKTDRESAFSYPQLVLGMIAIFLYVGVEVSTASNLPEFMRVHANISTSQIAPYISLFWASLMIGRWTGSVGALNLKSNATNILRFLMPYIAFGVYLLVNTITGQHLDSVNSLYAYALVIVLMIIGDVMSKGNPARQLIIFSTLAIASLIVGMLTDGMISVYAFISVGLYCSTLWPCIFTLAIKGLGKHTNEGSSLLIMMIFGGGIISLLQGVVADDSLLGIQYSYIVGVLCFLYLAFYGWKAGKILTKQGLSYDNKVSSGH